MELMKATKNTIQGVDYFSCKTGMPFTGTD